MDKPVVYKPGGAVQHSDVALTKDIARALVNLILEGKPIYPKTGFIHIHERDKPIVNLSRNTVDTWVKRLNVIPETGETLRDVLDKARVKRKELETARINKEILERARGGLNDILELPNNLGAKSVSSNYYRSKEGKMVNGGKTIYDRGVNTELVSIKAKASQFILERLDPEFARKDKLEAKHLVFSLEDLRQASTKQ